MKLSAVRHGLSFAHQTLEIPGELFNSRIDGRVLHEAVDDVRRHRDRLHAVLNRPYELTGVKALHPEDLEDYRKIFLDHGIDCFF